MIALAVIQHMKMRDLEFSKALGKRACLYTRRCHGSRNCRAEVIRSAFRFRLAKMSEMGQTEKYSAPADVFRSSPTADVGIARAERYTELEPSILLR
jgi:hypothetical protein